MTKLNINLQLGTIELEGEETFVQNIYEDLKDKLLNGFASAPFSPAKPANGNNDTGNKKEKTPRASGKTTKPGTGCGARIMELDSGKFFAKPKTAKEVAEKLEQNAMPYEGKHVAAALIGRTKAGKLRRVKQDGVWAYVAA